MFRKYKKFAEILGSDASAMENKLLMLVIVEACIILSGNFLL